MIGSPHRRLALAALLGLALMSPGCSSKSADPDTAEVTPPGGAVKPVPVPTPPGGEGAASAPAAPPSGDAKP